MGEMLLISGLVGGGIALILLLGGRWLLRPNYKGVPDPKKQWKRMVIADMIMTLAYAIFFITEIVLFFTTKEYIYLIQAVLSLVIVVPSFIIFKKNKNRKKDGAFLGEEKTEAEQIHREFFLMDIFEAILDLFT